MTNQDMFLKAHADARETVRKFGLPYRMAFKNALYGWRAYANGFTGELHEPKRSWT